MQVHGGGMYESFYGLREKPFNLTPDPRFLYLSEMHKEAFAHLIFGIRNRVGFIMVTGEIGTGKTTICRSLLGQLDQDVERRSFSIPVFRRRSCFGRSTRISAFVRGRSR